MNKNILDNINSPEDLRKLNKDELKQVCSELRQFIIDSVCINPGHFGASLGVVELTVALHYVYNTPFDKLVWDVGHQAYGHKILTGRKDKFHTNRKLNGLAGFPNIEESEYDAFGVGHASTSISAALGIALAAKKEAKGRKIAAVIGDGSLTGGLAFEGLNNLGNIDTNMLIIVNDNDIAIDKSTGGMKHTLTDLTTSKSYNKIKDDTWYFLGGVNKILPGTRRVIQKMEHAIKMALLKSSNMFESFNIRYFGPIDGHNILHLISTLERIKHIKGPKVLHIRTVKGKGFQLAEEDQTKWHAPGQFDKTTGEILSKAKSTGVKFQDVFGETILELAKKNDKITGVTPAMLSGCSLNLMMDEMPDRTFDVGIAEGHAVTFSAGMAVQGLIPYCNIYSSFLQRAYDNIIHDVALQKLNVIFCIDRGGLVGEDGATHHGVFDLAFMRSIPNMIVAAPSNSIDLRNMMYTAQKKKLGPISIRYPRGYCDISDWRGEFAEVEIGKGEILTEGSKVAILSIGVTTKFTTKAIEELSKENIQISHYDMKFVKPLDTALIDKACANHDVIITIEDGVINGGFGSAVLEYMSTQNIQKRVKRLGVPDAFIQHGTREQLIEICKFDTNSIINTVKETLQELK